MRAADMRPADMRAADMRRPEPTAAACPEAYSAAVPAKPATVSAKAVAAAVPAATAAAGVCFECERHDEEQHRGNGSAGRQHQLNGAAGLGAPHRRGRLSLGISPRTKSF